MCMDLSLRPLTYWREPIASGGRRKESPMSASVKLEAADTAAKRPADVDRVPPDSVWRVFASSLERIVCERSSLPIVGSRACR